MRIDTGQLVVIMIVRVLVCRWIIGVIHTRTQVSIVEILVLVVQPQREPYLLTRNQVSPRRRVKAENQAWRSCCKVAVLFVKNSISSASKTFKNAKIFNCHRTSLAVAAGGIMTS